MTWRPSGSVHGYSIYLYLWQSLMFRNLKLTCERDLCNGCNTHNNFLFQQQFGYHSIKLRSDHKTSPSSRVEVGVVSPTRCSTFPSVSATPTVFHSHFCGCTLCPSVLDVVERIVEPNLKVCSKYENQFYSLSGLAMELNIRAVTVCKPNILQPFFSFFFFPGWFSDSSTISLHT